MSVALCFIPDSSIYEKSLKWCRQESSLCNYSVGVKVLENALQQANDARKFTLLQRMMDKSETGTETTGSAGGANASLEAALAFARLTKIKLIIKVTYSATQRSALK
jgi:hypothetical protein